MVDISYIYLKLKDHPRWISSAKKMKIFVFMYNCQAFHFLYASKNDIKNTFSKYQEKILMGKSLRTTIIWDILQFIAITKKANRSFSFFRRILFKSVYRPNQILSATIHLFGQCYKMPDMSRILKQSTILTN